MHWDEPRLLALIADGLRRRDELLHAEHAIKGIDSLDETAMHPVIAESLAAGGLGVVREFPYPGPQGRRRLRRERERCDFVLTPGPDAAPLDPMTTLVDREEREATLFAAATPPSLPGLDPEQCYFLELKLVGQFVYLDGVPGPNRVYASQLTRSILKDLRKLGADDRVSRGAVLLVLFTADAAVAEHDLPIALHRVLDKQGTFRSPFIAKFPIDDRIGNACCTVALIGKA
jgi:hypothetical protein